MTFVLPRLDRTNATSLLERFRRLPIHEVVAAMPHRDVQVTYAPVGGRRVDDETLRKLRDQLLTLAREHGLPDPPKRIPTFEGRAARIVRASLDITPHEASHEEVWSYLTCCWLLDIAFWRFGRDASDDRFIGHINRNTFRRMWWRAEVLGEGVNLEKLGEDELVNIMERPTLCADRRVARSIATTFLRRVDAGDVGDRMRLMREGTKRLLRLTPFVAFVALDQGAIDRVVEDAFNTAAAGMAGETVAMPARIRFDLPPPTDGLEDVTRAPRVQAPLSKTGQLTGTPEFEELAQAAIDIARRTGRVTNMALRDAASITADEAREVFSVLLERGQLVRRGVKRGTHYVLPAPESSPEPTAVPVAPSESRPIPSSPSERSKDSALRRLLRRGR